MVYNVCCDFCEHDSHALFCYHAFPCCPGRHMIPCCPGKEDDDPMQRPGNPLLPKFRKVGLAWFVESERRTGAICYTPYRLRKKEATPVKEMTPVQAAKEMTPIPDPTPIPDAPVTEATPLLATPAQPSQLVQETVATAAAAIIASAEPTPLTIEPTIEPTLITEKAAPSASSRGSDVSAILSLHEEMAAFLPEPSVTASSIDMDALHDRFEVIRKEVAPCGWTLVKRIADTPGTPTFDIGIKPKAMVPILWTPRYIHIRKSQNAAGVSLVIYAVENEARIRRGVVGANEQKNLPPRPESPSRRSPRQLWKDFSHNVNEHSTLSLKTDPFLYVKELPKRRDLHGHGPFRTISLSHIEIENFDASRSDLFREFTDCCLNLIISEENEISVPHSPPTAQRGQTHLQRITSPIKGALESRGFKPKNPNDLPTSTKQTPGQNGRKESMIIRFTHPDICKLWKERLEELKQFGHHAYKPPSVNKVGTPPIIDHPTPPRSPLQRFAGKFTAFRPKEVYRTRG